MNESTESALLLAGSLESSAIDVGHFKSGSSSLPACYPQRNTGVILHPPVPIVDGGGCLSTADWSLPRERVDHFSALRKRFGQLASEWGLLQRLSTHVDGACEESLFISEEVAMLRQEVLSFLSSKGFGCDGSVAEHQPFLLHVWQALGTLTSDQDVELPSLLLEGVSTGIAQPILPSGVWEKKAEPVAVEQDLRVRLEPWRSASDNLPLAKQLVMEDVVAGHAFVIHGGEAEARERWGDRVAAGKLGVVQLPGKKPRFVGDGSISGANAAS